MMLVIRWNVTKGSFEIWSNIEKYAEKMISIQKLFLLLSVLSLSLISENAVQYGQLEYPMMKAVKCKIKMLINPKEHCQA